MKRLAPALALVAIAFSIQECSADSPKGKPLRSQDGQGRIGMLKNVDPSKIVERMMQEFDKDGDQKLDSKELTALLTSMRERMGQGFGAAADGQRKLRGGDGAAQPGGDRPKRPDVE
jgi:EF hand